MFQIHLYRQGDFTRTKCDANPACREEISVIQPGETMRHLQCELKASNACSILDHCQFFNETDLAKKCLDIIERNTEEALASDDFMSISSETLGVILDSAQLAMTEVKLFEKAFDWAQRRIDRSQNVRAVLGNNVYKIRFPIMTSGEFTEVVCSKDVLTQEEQIQIFKYLASPKTVDKPKAFCCEARRAQPPSHRQVNGKPLKSIHLHCIVVNVSN